MIIENGLKVHRAAGGMEYQVTAHREFESAGLYRWYAQIRHRVGGENQWGLWFDVRGFRHRFPDGFKNPNAAIYSGIGLMNGDIE